jgi:cytochrome c oxidase subunit 2
MVLARWTLAALALTAVALPGCDAPAEGAARGEYLYKNCVQCHGANGEGSALVHAPQIAGLPAWYVSGQLQKFRGGLRGAHPDDTAGLKMRPMSRTLKSVADVDSVAKYVEALPHSKPAVMVAGDVAKGQAAFATCAACHGADGAGNEALKSPPIRQLEDWYIVLELGKFKGGIRGYSKDDAQGQQMAGIAAGIADEAAMRDLAAYIQTLSAK